MLVHVTRVVSAPANRVQANKASNALKCNPEGFCYSRGSKFEVRIRIIKIVSAI